MDGSSGKFVFFSSVIDDQLDDNLVDVRFKTHFDIHANRLEQKSIAELITNGI